MEYIEKIQQFLTQPFLKEEYWGNTGLDFFITLAIFIALILVFKIFQSAVLRRLDSLADRTKSDIDDEFIKIIKTIRPRFYSFLAFYLAINYLTINDFLQTSINVVLIIWFTFQVVSAVQVLIDYIARKKLVEEDRQFRTAIGVASTFVKFSLWVIALLLILSNLGVNITSLVAGLGIGGIALAMAVKNILSDLLASFAIYFDKPFLVGDYIATSDTKGTVEKIGIKTTRLRAPSGEEIVVSNGDLISTKIQNFRNLKERRVSFQIGVVYNTPTEKLKRIPELIKNIVESEAQTRFSRVHFTTFADSSLVFNVVYHIESDDYDFYLDINEKINLNIKEAFEKEGMEMAYPTQTVILDKS